MRISGFECYRTYLALKNHFGTGNYDYFLYGGKTSVKEQTFKMRKDRYFFEAMARKRSDKEIVEFFLSNFVASDDPSKLWIRSIIREGEGNYISWKKIQTNLTYRFSSDIDEILESDLDSVLSCKEGSHPIILKRYLSGKICIETMVILDRILKFKKDYDNILKDPIWESVSSKMHKYSPFVKVETDKFIQIVKGKVE
tara:strand:- start:1322 stop:1915 length:594 start_codon:yes stop_codon:yes gene_type:complete